jgi:hypothetical protein
VRRHRREDEEFREPAAKPATGGILPGGGVSLVQGFDQSTLDLQKTIGNRAVLQMMQQEGSGAEREGRPLDPAIRAFMESRLGANLDDVRIHTGADASRKAALVDSAAFTFGKDIFFGAGRFAPHTHVGTHLLAHELSHVVQQKRGGRGAANAESSSLEAAASAAAGAVSRGHSAVPVAGVSAPGIARQNNPPPAAAKAKVYEYTFEGKTVRLTEEQYKAEVARTIHNLGLEFNRVESTAQIHRDTHQDFLDHTHNFFGVVSDILGDTVPPNIGIWSWPKPAIANGRGALDAGKVEVAGRQLKLAQSALRDAQHEWNSYMDKTIGGAQQAVSYLETTRDISFAIAIGTAAVVAAPVVAAGAAAAGLTGATATVATGAAITAGGGVAGAGLRGGSAAAGQGLAFGHVNLSEVKKEAAEGFKHGAVDASTALVTAGAGKLLGEGASVGGRVLRHAAAGGVGGGFSSGAEAISEGKSAGEVLGATGKGIASGFVGGGVTSRLGGSAAQQSAGRRVLAGTAGSLAGGTTASLLSGGSREDFKKGAVTSLITGLATSAATHSPTAPKGGAPSEAPRTPAAREAEVVPIGSATTSRRTGAPELSPGPREVTSLDEFRQRKMSAAPPAQEKPASVPAAPEKAGAPVPAAAEETNVRSLEEFRRRKTGAKAPKLPTEPQSAVMPVPQEHVQQAEFKLAAGAEGQTRQTLENPPAGAGRDATVASGNRPPHEDLLRRRLTLEETTQGSRTMTEHVEELGETSEVHDPGERGLPAAAGKAIERVELNAWQQELGDSHRVYTRRRFPAWLRGIFPGQSRPDMVAIDFNSKRILVGDVTTKPNVDHIEKTLDYARRLAGRLPAEFRDYNIVAQERYWELGGQTSKEIKIK